MASSSEHDYNSSSLKAHKKYGGKVSITSKMPLDTREDLSIAYTPGVAAACKKIADEKDTAYDYTWKKNSIAVVSDGSAVLGLGNIGPEGALPVMEGKAVLFKKFADIDAVPVVLDTQNEDEIVAAVQAIAPTYGGINLEDITAPKCFAVERRLKNSLDIPVIHDDQHGTAVVTLAGIINAADLTDRKIQDLKIVINGSGAAGVAIEKLLQYVGVEEIRMCDSKGIISKDRDNLNSVKEQMACETNKEGKHGNLGDALEEADIFIGVSVPDVLKQSMVKRMENDPIIFAMANPEPEIQPDDALDAGAKVIATGRSDYPNQINNVLAFPGLFRGALDARLHNITNEMYVAAAHAIAECVEHPSPDEIIPSAFDKRVARVVAGALEDAASN